MRFLLGLFLNLSVVAQNTYRPVGTYMRLRSEGSGGLLMFDRDADTLQLIVRLGDCVAAAHDVPYRAVGVSSSTGFWVVPDYSSSSFKASLDACKDPYVNSESFNHFAVVRKGDTPMGEISVHIGGGRRWIFELSRGEESPTTAPTTTRTPYTTRAPTPTTTMPYTTRAPTPTTTAPSPSRGTPQGRYEYSQSPNAASIVFNEDSQHMRLHVNLNGCGSSAYHIPYTISGIYGTEEQFWVLPDYSGTNLKRLIERCSDPVVHGGSFEQILVKAQNGVPMAELRIFVGGNTLWEFSHSSIPTPRPTVPRTTPPPTPTTLPRTTPPPTPTTLPPVVPTGPARPKGLYDAKSDGVSGQLVFFQTDELLFTMYITLGGCRLHFEDIPYTMHEANGASWVVPDYSSTRVADTLSHCRFYPNSRYELSDLQNIELKNAHDPAHQTLEIYRLSSTYGRAQAKIFENQ
ncbi:hypothetical protein Pmar_PMAR021790 [Perkinsus marinus ATCC 50983]|uniref:Uncharacterized protein n=1 Tax=Perkinsus marinus (strain ATCC 50983 / TXsc) TaxID=423536 RepID=C5LG30_PERM5|nr:hypothetical protein Pmar_PMAR021790 [Perkinsus marinus ATCC 50983]EER04285.1 hypothetical protein Pmar_PMAR021790 [Perkinsus marinus ATCC 50983]|eukprot:XP_002772469.1 hypothetical protein Pmar_PMAR021790 [Perkinsus marinus ATCC 50983]